MCLEYLNAQLTEHVFVPNLKNPPSVARVLGCGFPLGDVFGIRHDLGNVSLCLFTRILGWAHFFLGFYLDQHYAPIGEFKLDIDKVPMNPSVRLTAVRYHNLFRAP